MHVSELNFSEICRCCKLADNLMLKIHGANNDDPGLPRIDEMLMAVAAIRVREHDGMPSLMCAACINTLKIAFDFKKQLEQTDHELRTFLNSQKEVSNEITSFLNNLLDENLTATQVASLKTEPTVDSDDDVKVAEMNENDSDSDDDKALSTIKINKYKNVDHSAKKSESQTHQCKQCDKEYTSLKSFRRHVANLHAKTKEYVCTICQKKYTRSEHVRRHLYTHLKTKLLSCRKCNRGFNRQEHLSKHTDICDGSRVYSCDVCNKGFLQEITLKVHREMHENDEDRQKFVVLTANDFKHLEKFYKVIIPEGVDKPSVEDEVEEEAGNLEILKKSREKSEVDDYSDSDDSDDYKSRNKRKTTRNKGNVFPSGKKRGRPRKIRDTTATEHVEVHIQDGGRDDHFECPICHQTFTRMSLLAAHGKKYHKAQKGRVLKCSKCDKTFPRVYSLNRHQETHLRSEKNPKRATNDEVKPFPCNICTHTFETDDELLAHIKQRHRTCTVCCQMFGSVEQLAEHRLESGHLETNEEVTPPDDAISKSTRTLRKHWRFKCEKCKRSFSSQKYLHTHLLSHENPKTYSCLVCAKVFNSKSNLTEHMKIHASKKFLCSVCGQKFLRNDYLIIHMRRHRGDKPFKCTFCGKGFPRSTDLKDHVKYHTGVKSHLCTTCGRGFSRAHKLTVHMRTHTGEKPYKCTYCEQAFSQSNDLKAHVRRHTGERFQCDLCPDNFLMGYALTKHKRTVHGLNIVSNIRRFKSMDRLHPNEPPPTTVPLPAPIIPVTAICDNMVDNYANNS